MEAEHRRALGRPRAPQGAICPSATAPGRPATTASCAGGGMWHLGAAARLRVDQVRRGRGGGVGGERGLDRVVRAHQHAAEARRGVKGGSAEPTGRGPPEARSGRLLHEGVHLACDAPWAPPLGPGERGAQRNEAPLLGERLDAIRVARPAGAPGRPPDAPFSPAGRPRLRRPWPTPVAYARGLRPRLVQKAIEEAGHPARVPERRDQKERRARRGGGRPPAFDAEARRRGLPHRPNVVESCVSRLKQWRAVARR